VFTQQHHELLAETIERTVRSLDYDKDEAGRQAVALFTENLIIALEKDNPKFKRLRFIEAAFAKVNAARSATKKE
jgi:hypothetical protein